MCRGVVFLKRVAGGDLAFCENVLQLEKGGWVQNRLKS
jgi:hypothetical protein